jgi:predicted metallopeptidase
MTLEELEQQVTRLSWHEQLKLIAHISEQLSIIPLELSGETLTENVLRKQRERG